MKKVNGFTLIELMIVVAVIGALAVLAIPNYLAQTRKARRSEVEGGMQQLALFQERYRADCTSYANSFGDSTCTPAFPTLASAYTGSYYSLAIAGTPTTYTITATAKATGGQTKDSASGTLCSPLVYDFGTTPGTVTKTPAACWLK